MAEGTSGAHWIGCCLAFRVGLDAVQLICGLEICLSALSAVLLVTNESNSEIMELHTGGHTLYGEMRIA